MYQTKNNIFIIGNMSNGYGKEVLKECATKIKYP